MGFLNNIIKSAQQKADATSTKDDNSKSIIVDGFCNKKLKITPTGDGRLLNPQGLIINNKNTTATTIGKIINGFKDKHHEEYQIAKDGFLRYVGKCETKGFFDDFIQNAGNAVNSVVVGAKESISDIYDSTLTIVDDKVRKMVGGIDFNATLEALDKYQKEKGTDVSALTNFIKNIQEYANGAPSSSQEQKK